MVKTISTKTRAHIRTPRRGWPVALVEMAAEGRTDSGLGLHALLAEAGFATQPAMTIIIKRPRARQGSAATDPCVDDVLDALRGLCA